MQIDIHLCLQSIYNGYLLSSFLYPRIGEWAQISIHRTTSFGREEVNN